MLSFDNVPSSKMQKIYYDYLLHPQDVQRILDTTKDKVDKINGIIEQTILEVNASNKITTDSIREELDKLFERNYNIYTKPASYLYEVGNYIMRMFDGHMVNPEGYSTTTDYKVQRDYLYDLFNSNVSGRSFQFMKTDSGDYNHSHLTYSNYKLFKRDENDKLVPVDSVELHDAVRHVDLKFDVERYVDPVSSKIEYRDNADCKINMFKTNDGVNYEQKNNILVYTPDTIGENQSIISVPIRCEKTLDPATNYRYSSERDMSIPGYSVAPYDLNDGQCVVTSNGTFIYIYLPKDNYSQTNVIPGYLSSTEPASLIMQRIIPETVDGNVVYKLYRYKVPLTGRGFEFVNLSSSSQPPDDVRITIDCIDDTIFVWYIFSGGRSKKYKDFLLYMTKDSISDTGSLLNGGTLILPFSNLLGYIKSSDGIVNLPNVSKTVGLFTPMFNIDWSIFTRLLQGNKTDIKYRIDAPEILLTGDTDPYAPFYGTYFSGDDSEDFTNSTNIFKREPRFAYDVMTVDGGYRNMFTHEMTGQPRNLIVYTLNSSYNGDPSPELYAPIFYNLDQTGNFTGSSYLLSIPSFYHYITTKRLSLNDGNVSAVTHAHSVEVLRMYNVKNTDRIFFSSIIGNKFEILVNYRQNQSGVESEIYNSLLPIRMVNTTSDSIESIMGCYNENTYRKIKFCEYGSTLVVTNDSPYKFSIMNYNCSNSEIPEKLTCVISYINPGKTDQCYRLFEMENDIIFFPIEYHVYNAHYIITRNEVTGVRGIKRSPYTISGNERLIEYVSANNGPLKLFFGYDDIDLVRQNMDTNVLFEVDYNHIPKDIFSVVCKRVKSVITVDQEYEHDIVFRYGTYDGLSWFPMSTSNLSSPSMSTVRFTSVGTLVSMDNETTEINTKTGPYIRGAGSSTVLSSSSLVDIGFGVSLETATGQKEIIKSFNKSLYGDKISITCAIDYTNILKPIIGIPFDSEFLSNVNTIELNLILLNKVKTTIYLFNCYHNNVIYPPKNVPNRGKLKAKIFVPSDLYGYYYNNRNDLFRLDASNPKTREEYYDHTIDIYDLGTLKKYLPSGDSSVSFDDIYDFNSLSGIEDDKEKFRNYVDDSRFVARIAFDEPTKLVNIYPSIDPYKFGPDTVSGEKTGFEKFLNNGVRNFNKFKVLISDVANGNVEFIVDVNNKSVELTDRDRTGILDIYVNFLNVDQLNPDSEEVRKILFPTIISKQFLPFYITIMRDNPCSKTDGENAYYDMYVEIENNNDMQFRIHTSKYVSSDISNTDISFDGGTLITRAIETSEYMSAELHNNTGNTAKKLLDSGQYKRGDIYYFVPIRSSKDFETNNVYIQKKV